HIGDRHHPPCVIPSAHRREISCRRHRGIQNGHHGDLVTGCLYLPRHFQGYPTAKRVSAQIIGPLGLNFLQGLDVLGGNIFYPGERWRLTVESHGLEPIKGMAVLRQATCQVTKIQYIATGSGNTKKRWERSLGLESNQRREGERGRRLVQGLHQLVNGWLR